MSSVTRDSLLHTMPAPLANDAGMEVLGETAADALVASWENVILPSIFARIDELPEELLDILAKDFKVDWYDYNYALETKRNVIKGSFYVHKHLGTTGAVKRALSDVWPPSTVEEWFEYGGNPYHFRVILEATESSEPIRLDTALDVVKCYKPARAHLEGNIPILRVTFGIVIETGKWNTKYHVRACGTTPRVATHGDLENDGLIVGASAGNSAYHARPCGTPLTALM